MISVNSRIILLIKQRIITSTIIVILKIIQWICDTDDLFTIYNRHTNGSDFEGTTDSPASIENTVNVRKI